jgi:hypothetical protein
MDERDQVKEVTVQAVPLTEIIPKTTDQTVHTSNDITF